jgi:hypothetical protein
MNNTDKKQSFGIIQSRGLGDIIIALPIARYHYNQGKEVIWPICEEFYGSVKDSAPWVTWVPMPFDRIGKFFYEKAYFELGQRGCTDFICLYQSLTGHPELSGRPYFQFQKFDEHKYTAAGVPFANKWKLEECITRDSIKEDALYNRLVKNPNYYVTHLTGSNYQAKPDLSNIPPDWQRIDIDDNITDCVFDWLKIIEGAQALIALDSVVANIVDQLQLEVDKYWIPRSHIHLTPVLGSVWTILEAPADTVAAKPIFASK